MALLKDMSYQGRMSQSRSTGRLNSRVLVAIEWTEAGGKMRAEGSTVDISAKGCMAVVPQGFSVGQKLRLVNLTNQHSCGVQRPGFPPPMVALLPLFPCHLAGQKRTVSLGLGGFLGKTPTYGNPVAGSRWQDFARAGGGRNR